MIHHICAKTIKSNQQQLHTLSGQKKLIDRRIFDDPTSFFNQGNTLEKYEEERGSPCTRLLECTFLD
jgi:hypothetical protein